MKLQRPHATFGFTFRWQQVYDFAFFCQYKKMTNINQTEETPFDTGDLKKNIQWLQEGFNFFTWKKTHG